MTTLTVADLVAQGYSKSHATLAADWYAKLPPPAPPPTAAEIRAWANEREIPCPARGKIPGSVIELFMTGQAGAAGDTGNQARRVVVPSG